MCFGSFVFKFIFTGDILSEEQDKNWKWNGAAVTCVGQVNDRRGRCTRFGYLAILQ